MSNRNPDTGIAYGVIACNSLDSDVVNDLFYGPQATDLSYKEAYEEAKRVAESRFKCLMEQAEVAAAETDSHMGEQEREAFVERFFDRMELSSDEEQFVEDELEQFSDIVYIEEPTIEGIYEGVTQTS